MLLLFPNISISTPGMGRTEANVAGLGNLPVMSRCRPGQRWHKKEQHFCGKVDFRRVYMKRNDKDNVGIPYNFAYSSDRVRNGRTRDVGRMSDGHYG